MSRLKTWVVQRMVHRDVWVVMLGECNISVTFRTWRVGAGGLSFR